MANTSKMISGLSAPVPSGQNVPADLSEAVETMSNFLIWKMDARVLTVVAAMAPPSPASSDSLHLQLGPDGSLYSFRRFLNGPGWTQQNICIGHGTAFPAIAGNNASDRAYAAGMLFYRDDLNLGFNYDSINNVWRSYSSYKALTMVSGAYQALTSDDLISTTGGNYPVAMPDPTTCSGKTLIICTDGTPTLLAPLNVTGNLRGTPGSTIPLQAFQKLECFSNGSTWVYNDIPITRRINGDYTCSPFDTVIYCEGTSFTVTLASPATAGVRSITLVCDNNPTTDAPITVTGVIDSTSVNSPTISSSWAKITYYCDGTKWI